VFTVSRDLAFVLHESLFSKDVPNYDGELFYYLFEYTWDNNIGDLRRVNVFGSPAEVFGGPFETKLGDFLTFFICYRNAYCGDLVGVFEVFASRWIDCKYNDMGVSEKLATWCMCKFRWDVTP
jgi:hypothetical protein